MGMPLQGILQIGVSSLKAQQTALAVTSHNISNTNTEGYTRQRADLQSEMPLPLTPGQVGLGVNVVSIERMRDVLLDGNVRLEMGQKAKYDQLNQSLQTLEGVFGDATQSNLTTGLSDFFNAWQQLSNTPESQGVRQVLIEKGVALTDYFHDADTQITTQTSGLDLSVNQTASEINSITSQVALLNKEIVSGELGGNHANDLRDKRDKLLDDLSKYMDISVTEESDGMIDVTASGETLVNRDIFNDVQVVITGAVPHPQIQSINGVSMVTSGGKLAGYEQSYQALDDTRAQLDELANSIVEQTNTIVTSGYDLNGTGGLAYFEPAGITAATISVNSAVRGDPYKIVAASNTAPGNNEVALQMVALQDATVSYSTLPAGSFSSTVGAMMQKLGANTQNASQLNDTYTGNVEFVKQQRETITGVNMDEEMSNMIAYQRAYEAAARVITTVDSMMDTIINKMAVH